MDEARQRRQSLGLLSRASLPTALSTRERQTTNLRANEPDQLAGRVVRRALARLRIGELERRPRNYRRAFTYTSRRVFRDSQLLVRATSSRVCVSAGDVRAAGIAKMLPLKFSSEIR